MKKINEELLKEAYRRYPPGTKFINAARHFDDGKKTTNVVSNDSTYCSSYVRSSDNKAGITHEPNSSGWIYLDGLWADIVDSPKQKEYKEIMSFIKEMKL